jgi:anti-sigma B factor antagonist
MGSEVTSMANVNLTTQVRKINDQLSVVDINGEVTGFAESILMNAYLQASSGTNHAILFNFNGLEYMNSSGIGLLVTILVRGQRQKQRLMACGLSEHYRQIFELTRLSEAIGLFITEEDAIASIKEQVKP